MKRSISSFFMFIVLLSFGLHVEAKIKRQPNSVLYSECSREQNNKSCSYEIFKEITRLYRPSKEEGAVRTFISEIVSFANQNFEAWKAKPLVIEEDQKKNVLVRIPGTGSFQNLTPSIALQGHMDMTLKHVDEPDKEKVKAKFLNGIEIEEKDGWLQSKGNRSTLGADNGAGMAQMMFYILNPQVSHPPMELIFTVEEEAGLLGAKDMILDVRSKVLINLDSNIAGVNKSLLRSSMGGISKRISGFIATQNIKIAEQPQELLKIQISNLLGGHSGNDIHLSKERINTVFLFATLVQKLQSGEIAGAPSDLKLASVKVPGGTNSSIPNALEAVFAARSFSDQNVQAVLGWVTNQVETLVAEKSNANKKINVVKEAAGADLTVMDSSVLRNLASQILKMPNGLLINDPNFNDGVRSSSNVADLKFPLGDANLPEQNIQLGYMSRAAFAKEYQDSDQKTDQIFSSMITKKHVNLIGEFPAVTLDLKNWLIVQALKSCPEILKKVETGKGTSELSYLAGKLPGLNFLIMGPPLTGGDTVNEKLSISGMAEFQENLQKLIADISVNPEFTGSKAAKRSR